MKIEVKIEHQSGDVKFYPVHKLVKGNDGWTAYYTTVKAGCHVSKKAKVNRFEVILDINKRKVTGRHIVALWDAEVEG